MVETAPLLEVHPGMRPLPTELVGLCKSWVSSLMFSFLMERSQRC
ncbi:hypothetical protein B0813_000471 [Candidatus Fervidibacteria bacterium JGI MDM2 SSWTFF-3-K9]